MRTGMHVCTLHEWIHIHTHGHGTSKRMHIRCVTFCNYFALSICTSVCVGVLSCMVTSFFARAYVMQTEINNV